MAPRILITGASGQLGHALRQGYQSDENLLLTDTVPDSPDVKTLDISVRNQVKEQIDAFQPDVIINTAAFTDVDGNEREPDTAQLINTTSVEYLLAAGEQYGTRVVQISTDYVFDGTKGPYLENDRPSPLSVYGQTKLAAEQLLLTNGKHLIIRANVLFGPDLDSPASFVRWVVSSLKDGKSIRVVDDQVNNPTLTTHLAAAIRLAVDQKATGLYHYGGLEFMTRYQFALRIAQHFRLPDDLIEPISTAELGQLAPRPLKSGLICSKMKMELHVTNADIDEALSEAFPMD
ncbi:dTDP-4-dehydrorhamnose reductase [Candidatus Neomarinimicrobiota bacterium]